MLLSILAQAKEGVKENGRIVYQQHCIACHVDDRLGQIGPALLPGNLKRLRKKKSIRVISNGRPVTQMPAFKGTLTKEKIAAVNDFIYTNLPNIPEWDISMMWQSHVIHNHTYTLPSKPAHESDLLNLFTVVESGDHHVTILDGDKFEPIWRFPRRYALHGGAKNSPDGRYVYLGSRDGWVSKYDV